MAKLIKVSDTNADSRRRVAILYVDGLPTEIHYFRLPKFNEPRFYWSVSSYNSFRNREAERYARWAVRPNLLNKRKPLKLLVRLGDLVDRKHVLEDLDKEQPELPRVLHGSIFEFYAYVGFDYKRNSWAPRKQLTKEPKDG